MNRRRTTELMDDPGIDRAELDRALRFIRWANRHLGGVEAMLGPLRRWARWWPPGRPIRMLDIATGSADLPVAARRWALRAGIDLRVVGVDVHATTLDLAREHLARFPDEAAGIELVEADALVLMHQFEPDSFDYVHAGLFLHHLSELRVLTVLRIMDRLARAGLIWNDLVRSRVARVVIHALTLGAPEAVRHDARVSVEAGFTKREALALASRAGVERPRYRWNPLTHRFSLTAHRPDAWSDATLDGIVAEGAS